MRSEQQQTTNWKQTESFRAARSWYPRLRFRPRDHEPSTERVFLDTPEWKAGIAKVAAGIPAGKAVRSVDTIEAVVAS